MNLIYEGTDITSSVSITRAIHHDVSDRSDILEIEFDYPQTWYDWRPEMGDTIRVTDGRYDTGTLYLNTISPGYRRYSMFATGVSRTSNRPRYAYFIDKSLKQVMDACAGWCGLTSARYGISDSITYPYLICDNLGPTGFLKQLLEREGCVLKVLNGKLTAIGIEYAQNLAPSQTITIDSLTDETEYTDYKFERWSHVRVPFQGKKADASDSSVRGEDGETQILTVFPPDMQSATRWAKGLLLTHNRCCEQLKLSMEYNDTLSAMVRIDIDGPTAATGEWLIDECDHDFINRTTSLTLMRCQTGIK